MKKLIVAAAVLITLGASYLLSNNDVHTADNQPGIYTIVNLPF